MKGPSPAEGGATRDRILAFLRRGPGTVENLSREVGVTANSVRVQLASLERDRLVRRAGVQRRTRKPAHLYALTAEAEQAFSRAYVPLLGSVLEVLGERLGTAGKAAVLEEVGRRIARRHASRHTEPEERLRDALEVLGELGGAADVERHDGTVVVRGRGCPLGEVVRHDPQVCVALQTLLEEVTGMTVRESCERSDRPSCCFSIDLPEQDG